MERRARAPENLVKLKLDILSETELVRLAGDFAMALKPGDCVLLQGDLGAGKTTFARAAIRAVAGDLDCALEVPSPTFTLVQTYDLRLPVAHFDLYRISDPAEIDELGLEEALADGVALVEWPERGEGHLPADAILLSIAESAANAEARAISVAGPASFMERLRRSLAMRAFLEAGNWSGAARQFLLGDASIRAYETVHLAGRRAILMNAPKRPAGPPVYDGKTYAEIAHISEDIRPFVAIAGCLKERGFRAPDIYACDLDRGFVLLEHLGHDGVLDADRAPIPERYEAAVECLAAMHGIDWPTEIEFAGGSHRIPGFDLSALLIEVGLLVEWYLPRLTGVPVGEEDAEAFRALWTDLFAIIDRGPKTLLLRDFHSPNIIWDDRARGVSRVGLIDFQDAMIGSPAYDVASIVRDARVDIAPALQNRLLDHYCAVRSGTPGFDEEDFRRDFAILAAQRTTKILGIFVRLDERDGKPAYLDHIPRIRAYLAESLRHPALAALAAWYDAHGVFEAKPGRM